MAKGLSIHIGINYVNEKHYGSEHGLPNCANDAMAMQSIADQNGFESYLLLNEEATSHRFFYMLAEAASGLEPEDILFISFSGHGSFLKDVNGDEEDGKDETLVFYDRMVIDDELYIRWNKFRPGVRVLFIADSCYSGTITKQLRKSIFRRLFSREHLLEIEGMNDVYVRNKSTYDKELLGIPVKTKEPVECTVLLLSACQEDQVAGAGANAVREFSTFTEAIFQCWSEGRFEGDYSDFYHSIRKILKQSNSGQRPSYNRVGPNHSYFEQQIPFSI